MLPTLRIEEGAKPLSRKWDAGTGGSSFPQQGSLDWVNLTASSVSFSFGILARLSAASVDAYTITIGHLIGASYQLSRGGRSNVEKALSKLKCFGSLGNVLWFGFGIRHLVRSLSVTEEGATLVVLCATLGESFDNETAAEILYELVKCNTSSTSIPSLSQWKALVTCCTGIFAATEFSSRVETFTAMQVTRPSGASDRPDISNLENIQAIANALTGIGKLSRGEWTSIEISGGDAAGWLAAISEWFFSLSVSITDELGIQRHTSCAKNQIPQVDIYYTHSNAIARGHSVSQVAVMGKTFNLRSVGDLMNADTRTIKESINGRVQWGRYLSTSYGKGFDTLKKLKTSVGIMIGSAARVFEAIARAEGGVPFDILKDNDIYMDSAYGLGLLQTALEWLPELLHFDESMQSASQARTYSDAISTFEAHVAIVARTCSCQDCGRRDGETNARDCLLDMVETIIILCRLLATIECPLDLYPHRLGLKILLSEYHSAKSKQRMTNGKLSPISGVLAQGQPIHSHQGGLTRIRHALCLFAGYENEPSPDKTWAAFSRSGICVYHDSLREVSDDRQLLGRIHVVPGRIEYNGHSYSYLSDRHLGWQWARQDLDEDLWGKLQDPSVLDHVKLNVRESHQGLEVYYTVQSLAAHPVGINLSPELLSLRSGESRGLVTCDLSHSGKEGNHGSLSQSTLDQLKAANIEFKFLQSPLLGRCAALMIQGDTQNRVFSILQEKECLDCCIKVALENDPHTIIIISKRTIGR